MELTFSYMHSDMGAGTESGSSVKVVCVLNYGVISGYHFLLLIKIY